MGAGEKDVPLTVRLPMELVNKFLRLAAKEEGGINLVMRELIESYCND